MNPAPREPAEPRRELQMFGWTPSRWTVALAVLGCCLLTWWIKHQVNAVRVNANHGDSSFYFAVARNVAEGRGSPLDSPPHRLALAGVVEQRRLRHATERSLEAACHQVRDAFADVVPDDARLQRAQSEFTQRRVRRGREVGRRVEQRAVQIDQGCPHHGGAPARRRR